MNDFDSDLAALSEIAQFYGACEADPSRLLGAVKGRSADELQRYAAWVRTRVTERKEGEGKIGAVNFLRMVIVSRVLAGTPVALGDLEAVQASIEAADVAAFPDHAVFHAALARSTGWKRSPFTNWTPFRLLFGIDYFFRREEVKARLRRVAARLREASGCADCDTHTAGFDYNNRFGQSRSWLALYPGDAGGHRFAHQMFLSVGPERYEWGLVSGSRVAREVRRDTETSVHPPGLDVVVAGFARVAPAYHRANRDEQALAPAGAGAGAPRRRQPLNQILYGPPGTGKTYAARRRAVEIIDGSTPESDGELTDRFRKLVDAGRIEFVTFHPSYAYEEFVEGLRFDPESKVPVPSPGIFKALAARAVNPNQDVRAASPARVWKVSLGTASEGYVFDRSMENGEIAVDFSLGDVDFTGLGTDEIQAAFEARGRGGEGNTIRVFDYLVNVMEEGDYVVVLKDQKTIRAIGIVTDGGYRYKAGAYDAYVHTRPVRWLDQRDHRFYEVNGSKNIGMPTLYQLPHVQFDEFTALLPARSVAAEAPETDPRYVLVIDEINRGDLARVFGELITLLEPDKRRGAVNELTVRLPYSQETFRVPANLHVVGTMNTADRSIALFDVALRRRFEFEEVMPDREVIEADFAARQEDDGFELTEEESYQIALAFERLNARVAALLDRDHQIGHSYFLGLSSPDDVKRAWYRRVLPLLAEYFYNDRERLTQALGAYSPASGSGFVETTASADASWTGPHDGWGFHEYPTGEFAEALWRTFGGDQ